MSEDSQKKSAAQLLVDLALERYRFGVTLEGEAFGVPLTGGHVVRLLRGSRTSLRAELAAAYRKKTGKIAAQQALADALLVLEGEAQSAEPEAVHLRVAERGGVLWLDLGDATETVVRITPDGWELRYDAPVLFRRSALTGTLPVPTHGGDIAALWELLNVAPADRPLVVGWLVAALGVPDMPHPILALFGEQGTGKSTASKLLVDLVDPSPVPLRKPPRDMDAWVTAAMGSWVVGLDNLSQVPDWFSDTLCRAVTGDGDVRRQLYTDSGLTVFSFRRAVMLNGIDLGGLRGDLAERLLVVQLETIPDHARLTESELAARWAETRPGLLGALLDRVAGMAGILPSVRLGTSPRMADFARVLAALDGETGDGLARYMDKARTLSADSLASEPFIVAMMELSENFMGTAAELLALMSPEDRPRNWPTARTVTTLLKRNAPALRKLGWRVDDLGTANKNGVTEWHVQRPEKAGKSSPPSPPQSVLGGEAGKAGNKYGQSQDDHAETCLQCAAPIAAGTELLTCQTCRNGW